MTIPRSASQMLSASEANGLARALDLAATPGVPPGPNPRVGCVILDAQGSVVGEGYHRGAGTPHAEVDALARAGDRARGATAVVTLEPCDHHGRTPPCTDALIAAGIERVVYAMPDPSETAGGGAARLAAEGLDVVLVDSDQGRRAREFLAPWAFAVVHGRPFVTLKMAATLDGRVAAADGTSRWISGEESRRQVHRLRADVDAVVIGSETAIADDPELSVRLVDSAGYQPLRVVMGLRAVPMGSHLATSGSVHLRTRDPLAALDDLYARGVRHVLLEGGPSLAAAWLAADVVDRLIWFVAPVIVGEGRAAIGDFGIRTLADARRWQVVDVGQCGQDARIVAVPLP